MPAIDADAATRGLINRAAKISPLDDLAFDVYQDAETAAMIRQLARLKEEAVAGEDYQKAKQLKTVIDGLQTVRLAGVFEIQQGSSAVSVHLISAILLTLAGGRGAWSSRKAQDGGRRGRRL